jgi:hypothetical protein
VLIVKPRPTGRAQFCWRGSVLSDALEFSIELVEPTRVQIPELRRLYGSQKSEAAVLLSLGGTTRPCSISVAGQTGRS